MISDDELEKLELTRNSLHYPNRFIAGFRAAESRLGEEIARMKDYIPKERSDRELVRENNHLKAEIFRVQNSIDRMRMDMSAANARVDNWNNKRDTTTKQLAEKDETIRDLISALSFVVRMYFKGCESSGGTPIEEMLECRDLLTKHRTTLDTIEREEK